MQSSLKKYNAQQIHIASSLPACLLDFTTELATCPIDACLKISYDFLRPRSYFFPPHFWLHRSPFRINESEMWWLLILQQCLLLLKNAMLRYFTAARCKSSKINRVSWKRGWFSILWLCGLCAVRHWTSYIAQLVGALTGSMSPHSNSRRGGMATHAGVALELGITRPSGSGMKMMSPQMEAILIWCQCRVREYEVRNRFPDLAIFKKLRSVL